VVAQTETGESQQSPGESVQFWKEGINTLHGRTTANLRLNVSGDIDAIAQIKLEVPERQLEKVGKRSRTR
jgi:hypothetical protein